MSTVTSTSTARISPLFPRLPAAPPRSPILQIVLPTRRRSISLRGSLKPAAGGCGGAAYPSVDSEQRVDWFRQSWSYIRGHRRSTFVVAVSGEIVSSPLLDSILQTSEMEKQSHETPKLKLGSQGLEVSRLGFGCFGLTGSFNTPVTEEAGIAIIKDAFSKGISFFDTADCYGRQSNEIMIGKALKQLPREKIQLATKFGIVGYTSDGVEINGSPEYVRASCEGSLERLGVDYIDLYYQHRVDTSVPIEDTMGELKKLVEEEKVKFIGLSEASPDTIRRAHAVHPITAVQMEWSLWTRDIEEEIVPICRELGIGLVAYSPLGSGFFAGKASVEDLPENSVLVHHPKFKGDNLEKNKVLYANLKKLSMKHHCSTSQLALAWLLCQGNYVVPIPGTTKIKNLEENIGSLKVQLTEEDLKEISDAIPISEVGGPRLAGPFASLFWQSANTPAKD